MAVVNPLMRRTAGRNGGGNRVCVAICTSLVVVLSVALYFSSTSTSCKVTKIPAPRRYYRLWLDEEEDGEAVQLRTDAVPLPGGDGSKPVSRRFVYVDKEDLEALRERVSKLVAAGKRAVVNTPEVPLRREEPEPDVSTRETWSAGTGGGQGEANRATGGGETRSPELVTQEGSPVKEESTEDKEQNRLQREAEEDKKEADEEKKNDKEDEEVPEDGGRKDEEDGETPKTTGDGEQGENDAAENPGSVQSGGDGDSNQAGDTADKVELVNPPQPTALLPLSRQDKFKTKEEFVELYEVKGKTSFPICGHKFFEIVPCLDRHIHKLMNLDSLDRTRMQHYERHCPTPDLRLKCLIPPPPSYKVPIRWPASRDKVWRANVPHESLASYKNEQHWMELEGDKVSFPGGGTHFPEGAAKYIESLAEMLGDIAGKFSMGGRIRTVLDVGCGVASFGAFLLPLEIIGMSIAPHDVHENQIQFALERGIPAMLNILATKRLQYPSKSYDVAHCSRCRIDWSAGEGALLLEVDRLLRPGGHFVWSAPPAYRRKSPAAVALWHKMIELITRMCWRLVARQYQTAIFQKPADNTCYDAREAGTLPPMCEADDDGDSVWEVTTKPCLHRIPTDPTVWKTLPNWPSRMTIPPTRLGKTPFSPEDFTSDTDAWTSRAAGYWAKMAVEEDELRNVMDMDAKFGGFAAAVVKKPIWVMNVVPTSRPDTLPVVYDRGFIGALHNWCEGFNSYPRTYDLLHAGGLFSAPNEGCQLEDILLEADRLLRPRGRLIVRDTQATLDKVVALAARLRWDVKTYDVEKDAISPAAEEKLLIIRKRLWATPFEFTAVAAQ